MEVETHLLIADELRYFKPGQLAPLLEQIQGIGQMLNRLIQALRNR